LVSADRGDKAWKEIAAPMERDMHTTKKKIVKAAMHELISIQTSTIL